MRKTLLTDSILSRIIAGFHCLAVALLLPQGLAATQLDDAGFRFDRLWPALPQPWYFNAPNDLARDRDGFVYVADGGNERVVKYALDGSFVTEWPAVTREGEREPPSGVAVDAEGSVYLLFAYGGGIRKFDGDGNPIGDVLAPRELLSPTDLAYGPDGNLYVTCGGQDPDGALGARVSETRLVWAFATDGSYVNSWGTPGTGPGQLGLHRETASGPVGVAVTADGRVYVADNQNDRVQVFGTDGGYLGGWGAEGDGDGQFHFPSGILVDEISGHVYVADADYRTERIQRFTLDGAFVDVFYRNPDIDAGHFYPEGMMLGPEGMLYAADSGSGRVLLIERDGADARAWGGQSRSAGSFNLPGGIDVGAGGAVYVADQMNRRVQKFDADGRLLALWNGDDYASGAGHFYRPQDVAVDGDRVYVVADDELLVFDPQGRFVTGWRRPDDAYRFYAVATDAAGNVYASVLVEGTDSRPQRQRIVKYSAGGDLLHQWEWDSPNWTGPTGLEVGPDGYLYFAATWDQRIYRFTLDGELVDRWAVAPGEDGTPNYSAPPDVVVSADGTVWTVHNGREIRGFGADGTLLAAFSEKGAAPGAIQGPGGLALGPDGRLYVSDTFNHRVQVFDSAALGPAEGFKAIIVAGGGPGEDNALWNQTQLLANRAFAALRDQGLAKSKVKYLSSITHMDLDGNGVLDDLEPASLANLRAAVAEWAADAEDVVIALVGDGGPDYFRVNATEILAGADFSDWVGGLRASIPGRVNLVVESANSGAFLERLAQGGERQTAEAKSLRIITSTAPDQTAGVGRYGFDTFSSYFWQEVADGADLETAFQIGVSGVAARTVGGRSQSPRLDADGDAESDAGDLSDARGVCFGDCIPYGENRQTTRPVITDFPAQTDADGASADLWIKVLSDRPLIGAWAVIQPPELSPQDRNKSLVGLAELPLRCDDALYCSGRYEVFDRTGEYAVYFYAKNDHFKTALPVAAVVSRVDSGGDGTVALSGRVISGEGTPLCALVLAGGQFAFSCDGDGRFSLRVPLDANGGVTLFSFVQGMAPFTLDLVPETDSLTQDVIQLPVLPDSPALTVSRGVAGGSAGRVQIAGRVSSDDGTPLCGLVLANGQHLFSCGGNGEFSIDAPLDANGQVTLMAFVDGYLPFTEVLAP